jgi:hypothetical protein
MAERARLPNRRQAELLNFAHGGRKWTVSVGRNSVGQILEIFLDTEKASPLAEMAKESALTASLALQFGAPLSSLRHALNGRETGPLATALGLIEEGEQ